jgi:hypothetical protein
MSSYKIKYLKYKNKYLELKKLVGGTIDTVEQLNEKCEEEIKIDKFGDCPHCSYIHLTNLGPGKSNILTPRICYDHKSNEIYFYNTQISRIINKFNIITERFLPIKTLILLDTNKYFNISSYDINCNNISCKISMHPNDIDTLCPEGNIIWVNKNSKVGSTNINSCSFVVLILSDESKICIHHNKLDTDEYEDALLPDKKNPSYFYEKIKDILNENLRILKIYFCGGDLKSYGTIHFNYILLGTYEEKGEDIEPKNYFINTDGHFIIDNNNDLIKITN